MRALTSIVVLVSLAIGGHAEAQTTSRRLTTIDALRQFPAYYHLQNVLLRGEFVESGTKIVLRSNEQEIHAVLAENVSTMKGPVEVRGQLIDVGRMEPSDPRLGPIAEGRDSDRWPRPGEELLVRVTRVTAAETASVPTVRALALEPWTFEGRSLTVVGNFRGQNLFGDLPNAPGKSKYDFVLKGAEGAVWVTGLRPRGRGFDLDVDRRVDSDRWLEITGTVMHDRGLVRIEATKIALTKAPTLTELSEESGPPPIPPQPAEVVFNAPTEGETDVSPASSIRIQFSRGLNEGTLAGHVRIGYVGAPPASQAGLAFKTIFDAANRAIEIKFSQPLEPFRTIKLEILEGVKTFDGGPVKPWTLTFSVGG